MVTEQVPAWSTNRVNRLIRAPKRYITDCSLLVPLLGVDQRGVARDIDLLGRLIDTFVVSQLRPELSVAETMTTMSHIRQDAGRHEVDLVLESADGRIVGIEIKAGSAPDHRDARHLVWLREQISDRFVAGVVFHTGRLPYRIDENILALPVASIWG